MVASTFRQNTQAQEAKETTTEYWNLTGVHVVLFRLVNEDAKLPVVQLLPRFLCGHSQSVLTA